jgi:DNA modification methylase
MTDIQLIHGDCLEKMKDIPDGSVDFILCDLPYGTTACKWDVILPFDELWEHYDRIVKGNGAIVLFASEPFASYLRISNIRHFKYDLVWDKKRPTGQLNAKKQPLRQHEMICVFYDKQCTFNPIFHKNRLKREFIGKIEKSKKMSDDYGEQYDYISNISSSSLSYPRSIIEQTTVIGNSREKVAHPTQKPVALLEYLIRTYSNENDLVLDNCMGSGSTGVACVNTNRRFIGIEKEENYFEIAQKRINAERKQLKLNIV